MKKISNEPISVWIVEDNGLYRSTIAHLINNTSGMICRDEFSSCEPALKKIINKEYPNVCLLDIGLPGMDGVTCAGKIHSLNPNIKVIMCTVFDDDDHIFDALCAGASGYLLKASTEEMIVQGIRDVMNGGSPMNPTIAKKVVTAFTRLKNPGDEYSLTEREKEILLLMSKGSTKKEISQSLHLSYHTIDAHVRKIYDKLHVHSNVEAINKVIHQR